MNDGAQQLTASAEYEGWDDDFDVEVDDDDDDDDADNGIEVATETKVPPKLSVPPPPPAVQALSSSHTAQPLHTASGTTNQQTSEVVDGWDDDDDVFDEDGWNNNSNHKNESTNAWDEDEDEDDLQFDIEHSKDREREPSQSQTNEPTLHVPHDAPSHALQDLENYVNLLPYLKDSVAAVLETEYNNESKAMEVLQYFTERPGLVDYTIEKELPRMEYVVIQQDGMPLHEKAQIAAWMQYAGAQGSLLPRCANQSLLADLLQAMTGTDLLVRPQFLATVIAVSCQFVLDTIQNTVVVKSNLELSIPTEQGRWKLADISVLCQLVIPLPTTTQAPSITYRLDQVKPAKRDTTWHAQMTSASSLIASMEELHPNHDFDLNIGHPQQIGGMHYRDAFLQQSQNLIQNSTVGLRSAWKEIDAVAGISTKLSQLPSFLPEDVMEAAEREHAHTRVPVQPTSPEQRPTSILGGFLSSGLNRLAQTVTLPEEDPSYYQQLRQAEQQEQRDQRRQNPGQAFRAAASHGTPSVQPIPQLYRKPGNDGDLAVVAQGSQLYGQREPNEKPSNRSVSGGGLQLYRRDDPEPNSATPMPQTRSVPDVQPQSSSMHKLSQETMDGWDIEDDDIFSSDGVESDPVSGGDNAQITPQVNGHVTSMPPNSNNLANKEGWVYDPESDIRPTRKRWVNPRPSLRTPDYVANTGQ